MLQLMMRSVQVEFGKYPILPRALPFLIYIAFLLLLPALSYAWEMIYPAMLFDGRMVYPVKAGCVALLLVFFWHHYPELRKFNLESHEILWSIAIGAGVFVVWINLDQEWMRFGEAAGYDPRDELGNINWFLALSRLLGAVLVVPVMEELFWRSYLMRRIEHPDFLELSPGLVGLTGLLGSSMLFALAHTMWLAGLVAGLAYGALYTLKAKSLWAPVVAHATTNGLLGLWVLQGGRWDFW